MLFNFLIGVKVGNNHPGHWAFLPSLPSQIFSCWGDGDCGEELWRHPRPTLVLQVNFNPTLHQRQKTLNHKTVTSCQGGWGELVPLESKPGHHKRGSGQEWDLPRRRHATVCERPEEGWESHCALMNECISNTCVLTSYSLPDRWSTVVPRVVELSRGPRSRDLVIELEPLTPRHWCMRRNNTVLLGGDSRESSASVRSHCWGQFGH